MRATTLKKHGWLGTCATKAQGSISNKEFDIVIDTGRTMAEQLSTLAHEMVHVQQKATNKLQMRMWKSDRRFHVRWDGKDAGIFNSMPWGERPWEIEARSMQDKMARKFKRSMK